MIDAGRNTPLVRLLRWFAQQTFGRLFKLEFYGVENVPATGPLIIAPNHQTYLDPIFVGMAIRRKVRYMAWHKLFKVPILAPVIRWFGAFPVNIDRPSDRSAFWTGLQVLKAGEALVIFPEGGRSQDGRLQPLKAGVARLALASGAAVLPVTIVGGEKVWPPSRLLPRPGKVRLIFHEPIHINPDEKLDPRKQRHKIRELTEELGRRIASGFTIQKC